MVSTNLCARHLVKFYSRVAAFIFSTGGKMKKTTFNYILVVIVALLVCFAFGCNKQSETTRAPEKAPVADLNAEKAAVKTLLDKVVELFEKGDIKIAERIFAKDTDMINFGTDAAERWMGYEALMKSLEQQNAAVEEGKITIRDQEIRVHKSGTVAWYSEIIDFKGKSQGQPFAIEGMRQTGILEKREGNWVIVQTHSSVPVSGQAVKY